MMAKSKDEMPDGEVPKKDFKTAIQKYFQELKKNASEIGDLAQEMSTTMKFIKKQLGLQPAAFRQACKVFEMEEAKRDDWLRTFNGTLREFGVNPAPSDMVDMMLDPDTRERPKPKLVTIPAKKPTFDPNPPAAPEGDTDLANPDD